MSQIAVCLPEEIVEALDAAATALERGRDEIVKQAVERHLDDFDDLAVALERVRDPTDPALDWDRVRGALLGPDQAEPSKGAGSGSGA